MFQNIRLQSIPFPRNDIKVEHRFLEIGKGGINARNRSAPPLANRQQSLAYVARRLTPPSPPPNSVVLAIDDVSLFVRAYANDIYIYRCHELRSGSNSDEVKIIGGSSKIQDKHEKERKREGRRMAEGLLKYFSLTRVTPVMQASEDPVWTQA